MMDENKFLTKVEMNESNEASLVFNDGTKVDINISSLMDALNECQVKYKVRELWIDVPGHGIEELNYNDLVKFHVATEYECSDDKIQLIDKYVKVDDLIKFLSNYGEK